MTRIQVVTVGTQGPAGPASVSPGAIITTEGDFIIGAGGGAAARLAKGTVHQELAMISNRPAWRDKPVYNVLDHGTASSTGFNAALDAAGWDTGRTGAVTVQTGAHVTLPPGSYTLATEVSTNNTWNGRISGDAGTILIPGAAIDALIYMDGNSFFELDHLTFNDSPSNYLVQDLIKIERTADALNSVHDTHIHHIKIMAPDFVRAITIGKNSDIYDLAQSPVDHLTIIGEWSTGNTTKWQEGLHFGSGAYGNVLNFTADHVGLTFVRRAVYVDNVNTQLRDVNAGYCEAVAYGNPRFTFVHDGGYVEVCNHLAYFPGVDSYPRQMSWKNIHFSASGLNTDSVFVERAGDMLFENVSWFNYVYPGATPPPGSTPMLSQIVTGGTVGRTITFRNFQASESPEEIWTDINSSWQNIWLKFEGYTQLTGYPDFVPIATWNGLYVRTVDGDLTEELQFMPYDGLLIMDTSVYGFPQPVYLPNPAYNAGRHVYIQQKGTHAVTATAQSGDTIGGAGTTLATTGDGDTLHLISDGISNWIVV